MVIEVGFDANIALVNKINQKIRVILNTPVTLDTKESLKAKLISPYTRECRRNPNLEIQTQPSILIEERSELFRIIVATLRHYATNPTNQAIYTDSQLDVSY